MRSQLCPQCVSRLILGCSIGGVGQTGPSSDGRPVGDSRSDLLFPSSGSFKSTNGGLALAKLKIRRRECQLAHCACQGRARSFIDNNDVGALSGPNLQLIRGGSPSVQAGLPCFATEASPTIEPKFMRSVLCFLLSLFSIASFQGSAQPALEQQVAEQRVLEWNLPEALGFQVPALRRLDPALATGTRIRAIGSNDRWVVAIPAAGARFTVHRTEAIGEAIPAGDLAPDLTKLGEVVQVVIKEDDAIFVGQTGYMQVFRLQLPANGGHVLVGQSVGAVPPEGFRITAPGSRSAPGSNADFLYIPAGNDGLAIFDLSLPWYPKLYRTLSATRRINPAPAVDSDPVVNPTSVAIMSGQWVAVAVGDRRVRLLEAVFFSSWVDVDRGGWQAGEGETISQIAAHLGRLYAVVESPQGRRLQILSLAGGQLVPKGTLALPLDSAVRRLMMFGGDFVAGVAGLSGTFLIHVADENQPSWIGNVASLEGAETTDLAAQYPHLWVNDRPSDASHLSLGNADSASARYALTGNAPAGLTLSADGVLRWTPDETQGGAEYVVGFTRTVAGDAQPLSARVIVVESNQPPVISPVVPQVQTAVAGQPWRIEITVTDADLPAQAVSLTCDLPGIVVTNGASAGVFVLSAQQLPLQPIRRVTVVATDTGGASATVSFDLSVISNFVPVAPQAAAWAEHAVPPRPWPIDTIRAGDGRPVQFSLAEGPLPQGVQLSPQGNWVGVPDATAGVQANYVFQVRAILAGETNVVTYRVSMAAVDDPPIIDPIADQTYFYGEPLRVPIVARDPEGTNRFAYSAIGVSAALGVPNLDPLPIDPNAARIDWTPVSGGQPLGSYWVTLRVTEITGDGVGTPFATNGPSSEINFRLGPDPENRPPVWSNADPILLVARENQPLHFPVFRVRDPNGGLVPVSVLGSQAFNGFPNFPLNAAPDGSYAIADWTPGEDAGGRTVVLQLVASDLFNRNWTTTNEIRIRVAEENSAPRWEPVPVQFGQAGQLLAVPLARFVRDDDQLWDGNRLNPDSVTFRLAVGNPVEGNPAVTPEGIFTWRPPVGTDCNGVVFQVEAVDRSGAVAVGRIQVAAPQPEALLPVASHIDGDDRRDIWGGLAGWNLAHDLDWLPDHFIDEPNPRTRCFIKAFRSLSWLGARSDVQSIQNENPRGAVQFTDLSALPDTLALLGNDRRNGVLWLRFGEYHMTQDVRGVDWDYDAATRREWRIYHPRTEQELASIWMRDAGGRFFRLAQTPQKMPELHLEVDWGNTNQLADDRIYASSGPASMVQSFDGPVNVDPDALAFAQLVARTLADELAGKFLKFRMDQVVIANPADLIQAGINDGTFVEPNRQQFCNGSVSAVPIGLFRAMGAIEIASCDGLARSNRPPVLDPIGQLLAAPGDLLTHQLHATDPDQPRQALAYSLDAASQQRGLRVNPVTGLISWAVPNGTGCTNFAGSARVTDPLGLFDEEPFTVVVQPVRESAPVLGLKSEREGFLMIDRAGGHVLEWLPVPPGQWPLTAARTWVSGDSVPALVAPFGANLAAPTRGAHVGALSPTTLPRTQAALRAAGLTPTELGFRFAWSLGEDLPGQDWTYDAATTNEWRRYAGPVEILIGNRVLFALPRVELDVNITYSGPANPQDPRISGRTGELLIPDPTPNLAAMDLAIARAFLADLAGTLPRLTVESVTPVETVNRIDKGYPVTWCDLQGRLELLSCLPPYQPVSVRHQPTMLVPEGSEVVLDLIAEPMIPGLRYGLVDPPNGRMRISDTGRFTWQTDESDGGQSVIVRASVTDGISTAQTSFSVFVEEVNQPPRWSPIPDQYSNPGSLFRLQLTADDTDRPAQRLTYRLVRGPAGMQVDPVAGLLVWRPGAALSIGFSSAVEVAVSDGMAESTASFRISLLGVAAAKLQFRAFDGVLSGSRVWWDANLNGRYDIGEPSGMTTREGWANLEVPLSGNDRNGNGLLDGADGRLMLTGGVDLATGIPFTGRLAAPVDAAVLSPLTTLLDTLVRKTSRSEADIQNEIRTAFQLPAGLDVTLFDPWKPGMEVAPQALSVHAANALLADTSSLLGQLFLGRNPGLSLSQVADGVDSAWAEALLVQPEGFPGSRGWVHEVITRSASALGTPIDRVQADSVSRLIGFQNESKRSAVMGSDLVALLGMQTGSLGETAEGLRLVGSGKWSGEDLTLANQGWENRARQGLAWTDPYATNAHPGEFALSATSASVREEGIPVQPLTLIRSAGSSGSASIVLDFTDSIGRLKTNRMVMEFQDGERLKNIDWTRLLADDNQVAPNRTVTVTLMSVASSPVGGVLGGNRTAVVSILDDESAGIVAFAGTNQTFDVTSVTASGPGILRSEGLAGRLLVRVEYLAGNSSAAGQLPEAVTLEFATGVTRRIVPLPALTAPANGPQPLLVLRLSLAPGTTQGAALGGPTEMRVQYLSAPIAVVPAWIQKIESPSANVFRLSVSGPAGGKHSVETSFDLLTWKALNTPVTVVTQGDPIVLVEIPVDASATRSFFRLRTLLGP